MTLEVCECVCHRKMHGRTHFVGNGCCSLSQEVYISEDGVVDWIEVGKAMRKLGGKGDYTDE